MQDLNVRKDIHGSDTFTQRSTMPMNSFIYEVEPPSPMRYLIGSAIMMIGVVLPLGYMMFRNKRVPSSSSFAKQTGKVMI
ncbi:hypothetical protein QVD17_01698 [Tagetes erecta]|uniref:Uncharacterized protein n=1 Tax=Tagetes erecta TaxID=13708 RepID=A0AAD8LE43_TARER|nr:hypothetical protein QVD17_01698 [Tagetes erecta]